MRLVCDGSPADSADHFPPLSRHPGGADGHVEGSGCCVLRPACMRCQGAQAAQLRNETRSGRVATVELEVVEEPDGFPVDSPVWRVPWLVDLVDEMPADATWPRYMTVPHPDAVDSLGREFEWWAWARRGVTWRWWQRLVVRRLLEIDADGVLMWQTAVLTLARQLGKSWLLRDFMFWRMHQGERFGQEQTVLLVAKTLDNCRDVWREVIEWADPRVDYAVRVVNSQEELAWEVDGSRWLIRSQNSAYGKSAALAVVDEAWDVATKSVDMGLEPTIVARAQSQLLLVSTAHSQPEAMMLGRRASAIQQMLNPTDGEMILEWSAPRFFDITDETGWRMASPHWDRAREMMVRRNVRRALTGELVDQNESDPVMAIRTQWLNQWPATLLGRGRDEPLLDIGRWADLRGAAEDPLQLWVGVADNAGRGAGVVAVAEMSDGGYEIDGWICDDRRAALAEARATIDALPAHGVLIVEPGIASVAADAVAGLPADIRFGLPLLRELVDSGRLFHDQERPEFDQQLAKCRVHQVSGGGGLALAPGERSDLVRAAALALRAAVVRRPTAGIL